MKKLFILMAALVVALVVAVPSASAETYGASTINTPSSGQKQICPQAYGLEVWSNPAAPSQKLIGNRVKKDCTSANVYHVVGNCDTKLYKNGVGISGNGTWVSHNPTCNIRTTGVPFSFVNWQGVSRTEISLQSGYTFSAAPGSYLTIQDSATQSQCTISSNRMKKTCYFYDSDGVQVSS